ncbi:MAG: YeeE/YedE family protein [Nitrospiraceae bacterium]|nr:YeeE/YedE family protein [Nitrospiraceae bacterium]MDA8339195.1 YeeE/YedE family protein [Nitrospiraceae bacterium]
MEEISQASIMVLLSGLLVGVLFGFVLQRGRYCMNSAFRDIIFVNDFTLFRSYLLALLIAIIGANFLEDLGFMGELGLRRQSFNIVANIVGGYIFGIGIVMAGGCGSGIVYRTGEGYVSAFVATLGFASSLVASIHGPLKPFIQFLKSFKVSIGSGEDAVSNPALWDLFGGQSMKWIAIVVIAAIIIPIVLKGKPFAKGPKKGYSWSLTGLLLGLILILALWASNYWGGQTRGLSAAGPTAEAFLALTMGSSMSKFDPMFDFWGIFRGTWSGLYIFGIPLGAYISAKGLGEFKLQSPPASEIMRVFGGSLVMGFGAATAGGCTVGHALTGVSSLALSSIVATIFMILGNWTMVYFMFVKPMKD